MSSIPGIGDHSGAASSIYSGTYYDWSLGKWRADDLSLEVIVKDDWIYNSTGKNNYFQEYLLLHEIGHLLTLAHPFEDYVGDAKKLTMNKKEKNKYLNNTLSNNNNSSSKKKDDDILINYKWEHGRFSHPNEHFTNGVSKILSIPLNLHTVDILSGK